MGITIAYRGRLADLGRIEDFEDRLLDFALASGGLAQIWRSHADDDPQRMVRGVILELAPGQEPVSLLLSPEGWLIGLVDIEEAERGQLTEPPWCFVKTQFGPLEGHVTLAEDGLAEGLRRHGLSREAAEDPDILLRRIERIAAQVHRILQRPAEHPPVTIPDAETFPGVPDPEAAEALGGRAVDVMGGLAQALSRRAEENGPDEYGLRCAQLKRALRGAAFACAALFPLRPAVTTDQLDELHRRLRKLEQDIFHELSRLRSERRTDDS